MERLGYDGLDVFPKSNGSKSGDMGTISDDTGSQSPSGHSRINRGLGSSSRIHHTLAVSCTTPEVSSRTHRTFGVSCPSPEGSPGIHRTLNMCYPSPESSSRIHSTLGMSCPSPEGPSRIHRSLDVSCPSPEGAAEISTSRQLKFGMDRILSEDISPHNRRSGHTDLNSPPCSQCVSSLLRCCRLGPPYPGTYYPAQIHAPRPIRPYNNLLVSDGVLISPADRVSSASAGNKRKRSWSRAVFSNLQRKGLEKRFQLQKYITKPDRRQLAATLGLTDAQVKVWFQNRRMKWRHSKEAKHEGNLAVVSLERKEEQGRPDSTQEPEIDVQTIDI